MAMRWMNRPGLLLGVLDGGHLERRVLRLLDVPAMWGRRRRVVAAAACVAVMAALCVGGSMMAVRAQERATKFDVVSIKQDKSGSMGVSVGANRTGYRASNAPLVRVILEAYLVAPNSEILLPIDRLKDAPAWVMHDAYDITAQADEATIEAMKDMTETQRLAYEAPMLRAMLADRFKLATHTVSTEVQGYALVVGKHGIKMKVAPPDEPLRHIVLPRGLHAKYRPAQAHHTQHHRTPHRTRYPPPPSPHRRCFDQPHHPPLQTSASPAIQRPQQQPRQPLPVPPHRLSAFLQFSVGRSTRSTTNTCAAALPGTSFNPNCSTTAVNNPGASAFAEASAFAGVHVSVQS